MPKVETEKNNRGKKNTTSKNNVSKNRNTKANNKKVEVKNHPTNNKKAEVKKVETKKFEAKKVEAKKDDVKITKKANTSDLMENTPFVIACCVIILLCAALIFTICVKRVPKTKKGNQIIATVKGKNITADDLYVQLKNDNGTNALINIIDSYIAEKEVKVTKEDKEYVQNFVDSYKSYADSYGVDFATFMASYVGLPNITTEDEFFDYVLKDYKKTLAVIKFIGDEATEKELKAYYEENFSDKLTVRHILINIDSEEEDQEKAESDARNKALKLIEELNNTSEKNLVSKFEKLAKENSDDTGTYSEGGLVENFTKKDVVSEFFEAASKLKDNEYTKEPVKSTYGYHIILKISSTPREKYKDIKEDVKKEYARNLISTDNNLQIKKWDELRKQYKLSIKDDIIKKDYEKTLKNALAEKKEEDQ